MAMKTLLLNPPSFEKFDGGASSRWPATREIESYWYPVWLGYPAAMIREHSARISYVHLKGFQKEPFAFTPLDRGDVPTGPILTALRETGFTGWVCTELDAWPEPADGARISMDYLKQA